MWHKVVRGISHPSPTHAAPHGKRTCLGPGTREKGSLTFVKNIIQNIVTGWPLCHTYSVPTGRVLRPRARGPHTCRSCIVHAAATTSGPLGTGQPGMASRLKVAIKCGEASELECHIEGLLRQRGAPGEG